jgi:hypothetical protein
LDRHKTQKREQNDQKKKKTHRIPGGFTRDKRGWNATLVSEKEEEKEEEKK